MGSVGDLHQGPISQPIDDMALGNRVLETVDRHHTVGLAIDVVGREGLRLFHSHGVADGESKEPITEATVFRIASITKTFTAIAIMPSWERGLRRRSAGRRVFRRHRQRMSFSCASL